MRRINPVSEGQKAFRRLINPPVAQLDFERGPFSVRRLYHRVHLQIRVVSIVIDLCLVRLGMDSQVANQTFRCGAERSARK